MEAVSGTAYLGAASGCNGSKWETTVSFNGVPVKMKIDTGAEVTVISKATHKVVGSPPLRKPDKLLKGPSNKRMPVCGLFTAVLQRNDKEARQDVYVVSNLHSSLLRNPTIEDLGILAQVDGIGDGKDLVKRFPGLFRGLGKMEGEYHIKLEEGA